jgi:hypothetical protein
MQPVQTYILQESPKNSPKKSASYHCTQYAASATMEDNVRVKLIHHVKHPKNENPPVDTTGPHKHLVKI